MIRVQTNKDGSIEISCDACDQTFTYGIELEGDTTRALQHHVAQQHTDVAAPKAAARTQTLDTAALKEA